MSNTFHPDDDGIEEEGSVEGWDYPRPFGTGKLQRWREEPGLYEHLTGSLLPPSIPSTSTNVSPQPSHSTTPPLQPRAPSHLDFFTVANTENATATTRRDAFYVPPENQRFNNVILAFNTSTAFTRPTTTGTDKKSEQSPIETLCISARLMFPVRDGNIAEWEWWDQDRRDEAARWINTNLGELYSRGTCLAVWRKGIFGHRPT